MKVTLKLSRVTMNMEEATITAWAVPLGGAFHKGEPLYSIETEKVSMDVDAPCNGALLEILVAAGNEASVGDAVCTIEMRG